VRQVCIFQHLSEDEALLYVALPVGAHIVDVLDGTESRIRAAISIHRLEGGPGKLPILWVPRRSVGIVPCLKHLRAESKSAIAYPKGLVRIAGTVGIACDRPRYSFSRKSGLRHRVYDSSSVGDGEAEVNEGLVIGYHTSENEASARELRERLHPLLQLCSIPG